MGLALFQNMFHNLLIYTNNFCFGYIAVSCLFETFPGGWVGGLLARMGGGGSVLLGDTCGGGDAVL